MAKGGAAETPLGDDGDDGVGAMKRFDVVSELCRRIWRRRR